MVRGERNEFCSEYVKLEVHVGIDELEIRTWDWKRAGGEIQEHGQVGDSWGMCESE